MAGILEVVKRLGRGDSKTSLMTFPNVPITSVLKILNVNRAQFESTLPFPLVPLTPY